MARQHADVAVARRNLRLVTCSSHEQALRRRDFELERRPP